MSHTTGTFDNAFNIPIFYQKWLSAGDTCRGSVVIVHGLGEHSGRYTNLVDRLLPEGYAVYAADHQGFGRSGGPRGHVGRFADYLPDVHRMVEMARAEQPGLPLALFGHSMGGLIGLHYALAYPNTLDFLVISAPALRARPNQLLVLCTRVINWFYPTFSMRRPGDVSGISRDPEEVRRLVEDPLYVSKSSVRWAVELLAAQTHIRQRATELRLPLLMLQGMADQLVVPEATLEFYQQVSSHDKTLHAYPGYYHELHNDIGKEKPLDDIAQWLNQRMPKEDDKMTR